MSAMDDEVKMDGTARELPRCGTTRRSYGGRPSIRILWNGGPASVRAGSQAETA